MLFIFYLCTINILCYCNANLYKVDKHGDITKIETE